MVARSITWRCVWRLMQKLNREAQRALAAEEEHDNAWDYTFNSPCRSAPIPLRLTGDPSIIFGNMLSG